MYLKWRNWLTGTIGIWIDIWTLFTATDTHIHPTHPPDQNTVHLGPNWAENGDLAII